MDTALMGQRIRTLIAKKGTNQTGVAQKARVSKTVVNDLANGKVGEKVALRSVLKVAEALDVPLSYLLQEEDILIAEPPGVHAKLDELLGLIRRDAAPLQRGFEVVEAPSAPEGELIRVGVWGQTAAGPGAENEPASVPVEWISVPARLKPQNGVLRALYVRGDSMEPELSSGDIVVVWYPEKQAALRLLKEHELLAVTVTDVPGDPNATRTEYVKRYHFDSVAKAATLVSTNPAAPIVTINDDRSIVYVGRVEMTVRGKRR